MTRDILSGLAFTGIVTGIIDGLFSSALSVAFYHSTVARLFQAVASVLVGPEALKGGTRTMLLGILMHFGVAFAWSIVFWLLVDRVDPIRTLLGSSSGAVVISILFGPIIWMAMSLVVIPLLAQRPPINYRWWIQFFGHIPFVALPIVACTRTLATGLANDDLRQPRIASRVVHANHDQMLPRRQILDAH